VLGPVTSTSIVAYPVVIEFERIGRQLQSRMVWRLKLLTHRTRWVGKAGALADALCLMRLKRRGQCRHSHLGTSPHLNLLRRND
jgi:hypothetical protein